MWVLESDYRRPSGATRDRVYRLSGGAFVSMVELVHQLRGIEPPTVSGSCREAVGSCTRHYPNYARSCRGAGMHIYGRQSGFTVPRPIHPCLTKQTLSEFSSGESPAHVLTLSILKSTKTPSRGGLHSYVENQQRSFKEVGEVEEAILRHYRKASEARESKWED